MNENTTNSPDSDKVPDVDVENEEKKERTSNTKKITFIIFSFILVYILFAFIIPFDGATIFDRRNVARYEHVIKDKQFRKLQVYVTCVDFNGNKRKVSVEELGTKSYDICLVFEKTGLFTEEYFALSEKFIETQKGGDRLKEIYVQSNVAGANKIFENVNVDFLAKYTIEKFSATVKRKWYHYFLL